MFELLRMDCFGKYYKIYGCMFYLREYWFKGCGYYLV